MANCWLRGRSRAGERRAAGVVRVSCPAACLWWLMRVAVNASPSHARTHEAGSHVEEANMAARTKNRTRHRTRHRWEAARLRDCETVRVLTTSVICSKLQTATISQRTQHERQDEQARSSHCDWYWAGELERLVEQSVSI